MICGSLRRPSPKGKPLAIPALGLCVVVDPRGPERGRHRVKRGGSFYDFAESVHCGARDGYSEPGRYVNIGARVLVEP